MSEALPPVPRLDPTLLREHAVAHMKLDEALDAAPPASARLLTRLATRTTVSAIAHIRTSVRGRDSPPLFPVPRSFLSATDRLRIDACASAYRYVDSRLAMVKLGIEQPPAVLPETPYVLNALAEGRLDNPDEMNPGMIRGVEFEGDLPVASYPARRRDECRRLLTDAVIMVNEDTSAAAIRAAWMLYVLGEIHPFGDGNGRVARLLYLLVTGMQMPRTVDWGIVEQLRYHQDAWGNSLRDRDVTPSAVATTELSIAGARLMLARLVALGDLIREVRRQLGLTEVAAVCIVALWLRRVGHLGDVALDLDLSYQSALVESEKLAQSGIVLRTHTQDAKRTFGPSYVLTDEVSASLLAMV